MQIQIDGKAFQARKLEDVSEPSINYPGRTISGAKFEVHVRREIDYDALNDLARGSSAQVDEQSWVTASCAMKSSSYSGADFTSAIFDLKLVDAETPPTFTEITINGLPRTVLKWKSARYDDADLHSFLLSMTADESIALTQAMIDSKDSLSVQRIGVDSEAWTGVLSPGCAWSSSDGGAVHRVVRVGVTPKGLLTTAEAIRTLNLEREVLSLTKQLAALAQQVSELSGKPATDAHPHIAANYWDRLDKVADASAWL
jgi:hypothetical protein